MSTSIAVAGFFVLAGVGCLSGVDPLTCGIRAVIGAAAMYVLAKMAGRIVLKIMVDAVIRGAKPDEGFTDDARERQ